MKFWIWLFPLTYLIHIAEEYWGGEGFYNWFSGLTGADFSRTDFLIVNSVALCVMVAATGLAAASPAFRFPLVVVGGIVLLNAFLHVSLSLATQSYSPGAISGLFCWTPLGVHTLRRLWRELPLSTFSAGIALSLGLHTLVSVSALKM